MKLAARLVNFDHPDAECKILHDFGINSDLGPFLDEHLTGVLRQQHPEISIESIEFIYLLPSKIDGFQLPEEDLVAVRSIDIPYILKLIVRKSRRKYVLDLRVVLKLNVAEGSTTDVFVLNETPLTTDAPSS